MRLGRSYLIIVSSAVIASSGSIAAPTELSNAQSHITERGAEDVYVAARRRLAIALRRRAFGERLTQQQGVAEKSLPRGHLGIA